MDRSMVLRGDQPP